MSDGVSRSSLAAIARAEGRLSLSFRVRGGRTVIGRFEQAGSLRARLPRPESGAFAGAVTMNTAGGIASGDSLATSVLWEPEAAATVSAAAAERVYRARHGEAAARVQTLLDVREGGIAEWLPQETILFDGARLDRTLSVRLAEGASCLVVEALVFGRTARGEAMRGGLLRDRVEITRGGRLVHADTVRLEGDIAAVLARPAVASGGVAVASVIRAGPAGEAARDQLRHAFAGLAGAEAGASLREGLVLGRIVARDGASLRRGVLAALAALRQDRPVPRVWLC
jgi:urease accessory protein